jgi:hypothetical protein
MGGCTIDLSHEYSAPWEKVVVSYIHKMENDADGEVERRDVEIQHGVPSPQIAAPAVSSGLDSSSASDPGDSPSSCDEEGEEEEPSARRATGVREQCDRGAMIEAGDRVRLTQDGERCHPDGCLRPGGIGEVLAEGQFAIHHRSWDRTVSKLRVQALGGAKRVYWYPRTALQLEHRSTPAVAPKPEECLPAEAEAGVPPPVAGETCARELSVEAARWAYAIDFSMPWVFRKLFSLDTVQLATTERLDMRDRVLENTMVNVSTVMGVQISEWTRVAPNLETGGCTWTRRLTVEYPDWLPEWAVTKIKKAYTDASVGARAKDEKLFRHADCEERVLSCAESAAFYRELGLADDTGLLFAPCGH